MRFRNTPEPDYVAMIKAFKASPSAVEYNHRDLRSGVIGSLLFVKDQSNCNFNNYNLHPNFSTYIWISRKVHIVLGKRRLVKILEHAGVLKFSIYSEGGK